jgi:hypothetical protein
MQFDKDENIRREKKRQSDQEYDEYIYNDGWTLQNNSQRSPESIGKYLRIFS